LKFLLKLMENCFKELENHFNESLKYFKDSFNITTRTSETPCKIARRTKIDR
jgi:hypothetical protein